VASSNIILKSDGTERARFKSSGDISFRDTSINEAFYWDASAASLGIGTTSPSALLHVSGSSPIIQTQDTDGTNQIGRMYQFGADLTLSSRNNTSRGSFSFQSSNGTDTVERMRIDSSGRVGIGTDSPDTLLDVAKDGTGNDAPIIRITNKKGIGNWSAVTDSMGKLEFYSDDSSGNAPYATGFVSVENDFTTGAPTLPSGALVFGTATYNASGGAVERMRIDSSGRVGIGINSPDEIFHIKATNAPTIRIESGDTSGAASEIIGEVDFWGNDFSGTGRDSRAFVRAEYEDAFARAALVFGSGDFNSTATERMRINSIGNVGIGTDSPAVKLHINNSVNTSSGAVEVLRATTTTNTTRGLAVSLFNQGGQNDAGVDFNAQHTTNATLTFSTDSSERLRIDSSGNVGIGISNANYKLNLSNSNALTAVYQQFTNGTTGTTANDGTVMGIDSDGDFIIVNQEAKDIKLYTSNTERLRIDSSGRVGIGMTPSNYSGYMLQVNGGTQSFMSFGNSATGTGALNGLVIGNDSTGADIYQREEQPLRFHTNSTERMRIDSSGKVGINESNPTAALHVVNSNAIGESIATFEALTAKNGYVYINADDNRRKSLVFQSGGVDKFSMGVGDSDELSTSTFFIGAGKGGGNNADFVIDSSGNVGIGTTSPSHNLTINSATGGQLQFQYNTSARLRIEADSGGGSYYAAAGFYHRFFTSGVERLRITSGGQVRINKTSSGSFGSALQVQTIDGSNILELNQSGTGNYLAIFTHGSTVVGAITENGTSTSYGTTSDYRLKENVVPMNGALDRVDALKPSRFNFIADADKTVDGFLAHEVAEVVPEAISGEKDAVDEEGNAIYQGIDQSKLVPLLVGAIQELRAEIETLKSQIQ
jgi:hypothetical protein